MGGAEAVHPHRATAAVAALALAAAGAALGASSASVKISSCGKLLVRPKVLLVTCARQNYRLAGLKWSSWGDARARAKGIARIKSCRPSCAATRFKSYPVRVVAERKRKCRVAVRYTRILIRFVAKRPRAYPNPDVQTSFC